MKNVIDGLDAILFDMDGTLVTSIACVDRVWTKWALRVGLEPQAVLSVIHGRPARDSISELAPDRPLADEEAWVLEQELLETKGIEAITGVHAFLRSLGSYPWAIVTSADRALALHRLTITKIPMPRVLVTINDVKRGKPDPECFLLAAHKLGVDPKRCLVIEDTNAGLRAGKAAGMKLLGITTTFDESELISEMNFKDYRSLRFEAKSQNLILI